MHISGVYINNRYRVENREPLSKLKIVKKKTPRYQITQLGGIVNLIKRLQGYGGGYTE